MGGDGQHGKRVRVHVASLNTAAATELCIRSLRRFAGYPFELTVGDSGSMDGTLDMLRGLEQRGWLRLDVAPEGRRHFEWLDGWLRGCAEDYAVFVDSDVEFRAAGALRDLVETACRTGAALVAAEPVAELRSFVEPVGGKTIRLAERFSAWLFLVDVRQTMDIPASFAFQAVETDSVPEGILAWDTGGLFLRTVKHSGLTWTAMPESYRAKFKHYGGFEWLPKYAVGVSNRKRRQFRAVERRASRLRRHQDKGIPLWRLYLGV